MSNNFISNENKAFIWQILMEANAFNNISNDKFQQINFTYEAIISDISINTRMSLIEKNKLLMSKMLELLKHLKYENQLKINIQIRTGQIHPVGDGVVLVPDSREWYVPSGGALQVGDWGASSPLVSHAAP
jgi:hypothetical protein